MPVLVGICGALLGGGVLVLTDAHGIEQLERLGYMLADTDTDTDADERLDVQVAVVER